MDAKSASSLADANADSVEGTAQQGVGRYAQVGPSLATLSVSHTLWAHAHQILGLSWHARSHTRLDLATSSCLSSFTHALAHSSTHFLDLLLSLAPRAM